MPSSAARREKLVSPGNLALMAGLFVAAFYVMLPGRDAFTFSNGVDAISSVDPVGELDIAYLKARSAAGVQSPEEISSAVLALLNSGQVVSAKALLDEYKHVSLTRAQRFSFDLELASIDYQSAKSKQEKATARAQLLTRLSQLQQQSQFHNINLLNRAAQLSEQVQDTPTSVAFYRLLAVEDKTNQVHWFTQCAHSLAVNQDALGSIHCYDQALQFTKNKEAVFSLRVAQLEQIAVLENPVKLDSALDELERHIPKSIKQHKKLAEAMLAVQRPDRAHLIYGQLANMDTQDKTLFWLNKASTWAEAANEPVRAIEYLDEAISQTSGLQKESLLVRAEKLLIATGNHSRALNRVKEMIKTRPDDSGLLRRGIEQARAANDQALVRQWNKQLLALDPLDRDAVDLQIELSMAQRNLNDALKWSQQALALNPSSREHREKLARLYEWTGSPDLAMAEWRRIASLYQDSGSLAEVARLAEMTRASDIALSSLQARLRMSVPSDDDVKKLIALYELEGLPRSGAAAIDELISLHGHRPFWIRELAMLNKRNVYYAEALSSWERYAGLYGRASEETLNRMELHWLLNQPDKAAEVASNLDGTSLVSDASNIQLQVLSEIAWRYRMPALATLAKPLLNEIEDENEKLALNKRMIQTLQDDGRNLDAIAEAVSLWRTSGESAVAIGAMGLAFKIGDADAAAPFLADDNDTKRLQKLPSYWSLVASIRVKQGDSAAAMRAYQQAIAIDASNINALNGLLWLLIDQQETRAINVFLTEYDTVAQSQPALWSAFAVGHLQIGNANQSLAWFEKLGDGIDADYNMLLTYADALEYTGLADKSRKVRLYALRKLRPLLTGSTENDQAQLLGQYARLLNRYGGTEENERLVEQLLADSGSQVGEEKFWREDIAISWLMATQRHEHARMVMAGLHGDRLKTPAWQSLAIAMQTDDYAQIQAIINGQGNVSIGNHILALRQLGEDNAAFKLAEKSVIHAPSYTDREIARGQFGYLLSRRPSYASATVKSLSLNTLDIDERVAQFRKSFSQTGLGLELTLVQNAFSSSRFTISEEFDQADASLSLFHGDQRFGGRITAGINTSENSDESYVTSQHYLRNRKGSQSLSAEFSYNEQIAGSPVLRLAARQHRATFGYEANFGKQEFFRVQADVNQINSRVTDKRIARGLQTRVEIGTRGFFGANHWSTSIAANTSRNEREASLPDELQSQPFAVGNVGLLDSSSSVRLGASLSRGGVNSDFPQVTSPRYYVNASVGHAWPERAIGVQVDGGVGVRILGGDELSMGFAHDSQLDLDAGASSIFGVNYRYHF